MLLKAPDKSSNCSQEELIDTLKKLKLYLAIKCVVRGQPHTTDEKWCVSKAVDLFDIFWKIL